MSFKKYPTLTRTDLEIGHLLVKLLHSACIKYLISLVCIYLKDSVQVLARFCQSSFKRLFCNIFRTFIEEVNTFK